MDNMLYETQQTGGLRDTSSPLSAFHLMGVRSDKSFADIRETGLSPALFSAYRDLSHIRYDYPLVLVGVNSDDAYFCSLTDIIDTLLQELAPPGLEGESLRKNVLGLEGEIRSLTQLGATGTLLELWDQATGNLLTSTENAGREILSENLNRARAALADDGELIPCDGETPTKVLTHVWAMAQQAKAKKFFAQIDEMILRLSNILKADSMRTQEALSAETLKRSVGSVYEQAFDFNAMSDILGSALVDDRVPGNRRRRLNAVITTLESQRFFVRSGDGPSKSQKKKGYRFVHDHCARAFDAYRKRLPKMVEVIKAMTIAQLEIDNHYKEAAHDPFFRNFDERFLSADELAIFPTYLVVLRDGTHSGSEIGKMTEILSAGLPIKVLVQHDDLFENAAMTKDRGFSNVRRARLAAMALSLDGIFVLQASVASLNGVRDSISSGMKSAAPALFNVFSGLTGRPVQTANSTYNMPVYLCAAAATESRAFPCFVHDPECGKDWASRFSIDAAPQTTTSWPRHTFSYEDEDLQKKTEDIAFTFVDFVAADPRHARSFACIPMSKWQDTMVPVDAFLDIDVEAASTKVPYILMVDAHNALHRVIVDKALIEAARQCRTSWRSLQELGGINNSHVLRKLEAERHIWEKDKEREMEVLKGQSQSTAGAAPQAPKVSTLESPITKIVMSAGTEEQENREPIAQAMSDEPYIETPRCTTCDECTQISNKMFAYDDNKQAYIADITAGTFRQLVEAAETCQVAIIHPGAPTDPNEPGLDELIIRAAPFN
jgi:ferredoxin